MTTVATELRERGFVVCRGLISAQAVHRARKKLEEVVDRHLQTALESGELWMFQRVG